MDSNGTLLYHTVTTNNFREKTNISYDKNGEKSFNILNKKILTKTKTNDRIQPKTIINQKIVRSEFTHTNSDSNAPKTIPNENPVSCAFRDYNSDLIAPKTVTNKKSVRFEFKDSNSNSDSHINIDLNSNEKKTLYSKHGNKQGVQMETFDKQTSTDSHSNQSTDSHSNEKKLLSSKHGYKRRVEKKKDYKNANVLR